MATVQHALLATAASFTVTVAVHACPPAIATTCNALIGALH
jgi:hypothetical protein